MRIPRDHVHTQWDNTLQPVAHITPGSTLDLELHNAAGPQIRRTSTAADIALLNAAGLNPVTGPLAIEGAMPGDTVVVEILDIVVGDWGWTANIPGFGLLAADFPDPYLHLSNVDAEGVAFLGGITLPTVPMLGTIGLAPAGAHPLSMIPPHAHGGNLDIRHITAGARLLLPVGVPGGLLSMGDTHAAMGDGEVCGTGIETDSVVTVRVDLRRGRSIPTPIIETDGRATRGGPALITTGIGPDLWQAARDATRSLVEELVRRTGLSPVEAYLLASVTADMHVSEIVDLPNVVVTMHVPLSVLA
jgi:acetamidase/formamidase